MRQIKLISVDMGKNNLNAFDGEKEFSCVSTFIEGVERLDKGYQVLKDGKRYLIGDETIPYDLDLTKEKESHKIMMYFAIHQLVENGDRVKVVTNCPMDVYLNKVARQSFKEFLSKTTNEDKKIQLTVGRFTKSFYLEEVIVMPEGMGIVFNQPELFIRNYVGVIDIGGVTQNFGAFDNLGLVRGKSFTEINGMHYLRTQIKDALKKEGAIIGDIDVKYLMNNPGKYKRTIDKAIDEFFEVIRTSIVARNWGDSIKLVFTGGGSLELNRQIETYFPYSTISEDALFDNCKGNYRVGVLKCQNKQEKQKC